MAPNKSLVLVAALLLTATAASGQLLGGLLPTTLNPILSLSGAIGLPVGSPLNASLVPPFANVTVQLVCGTTVVATATTNSNGAFTITPGSVSNTSPLLVTSLLSGQCRVVVPTSVSLGGTTGTLSAPVFPLANVTAVVGNALATTQSILTIPSTVVGGTVLPLFTGLFSLLAGLG